MSGKLNKVEPAGRVYFSLPDLSTKIDRNRLCSQGIPVRPRRIMVKYTNEKKKKRGRNFRSLSQMECFGQNAIIYIREGLG